MKKQTVLFFCFLFIVAISEAAIWEDIPALPGSQRVRHEEVVVNNNPVQTTIYSTTLSPEEIVKFYKTKLSSFGWGLKSEVTQQGMTLLVFSKGDKLLNMTIQNILGGNYITIMQSRMSQEPLKPCPECEKKLEEIKKDLKLSNESGEKKIEIPTDAISKEQETDTPGRDLQFVPRYPGAVRVNDIEKENGKKVNITYYAKDPVENIINFYRQNMGNYYWKLENEVDFQNLPEGVSEKINVNIQGQSLVFKSPSASCIISITEEPKSKATIIGVNYNEK
jgi:hypothetical protein